MPLLLASTCEKDDRDKDGIVCTEQAVSGLNVKVSLQDDTSSNPSGIIVTAKDGLYTEDLIVHDASKSDFYGAIERKGNYSITVSKTGYKTFTSSTITVTADRCHVIPKIITVVLEPK
jgi:hypothetical protein